LQQRRGRGAHPTHVGQKEFTAVAGEAKKNGEDRPVRFPREKTLASGVKIEATKGEFARRK
jgi:hypothetical protein